jgi:hypothetical protein
MTKLRPNQMRQPGKKITREVLRSNPMLAKIIRERAREIRNLRAKTSKATLRRD